MDGRPLTSAAERLKRMLANALERVCVLEAELEQRERELAELTKLADPPESDGG